jgi:hypothetical protein
MKAHWNPAAVGWVRDDGLVVVIHPTCSTALAAGQELLAWVSDFEGPGRPDAAAVATIVDELAPLGGPRAVPRVHELLPRVLPAGLPELPAEEGIHLMNSAGNDPARRPGRPGARWRS